VQLLHDPGLDSTPEKASKHVDRQHEQLWGERVALAQTSPVPNWWSRLTIEEHTGAGAGEEDCQPLQESVSKTILSQGFQE
jgi:hypothetical protein